jgi:hypothetical protein
VSVESLLESWDGRGVEPFRHAAQVVPQEPAALMGLLRLARSPSDRVEVGATWVLKHHLEAGVVCDGRTGGSLIALISRARREESRLHLLQCLPFLQLSAAQATKLHPTLLEEIASPNAFVRAWAYNGLGLLVRHDDRFLPEVRDLFQAAMASDTAAVKARIRNVCKPLSVDLS